MSKIVVLGLGNLMRTDDGAGISALHLLLADKRLPADIQMIEGGTLGLDLLHPLQGVTHLVVLDAVDVGAAPGALLRFENAELAALPVAKSVHLLGFADLLGAMKLLGHAPEEIVLLGIQPESTDWGVVLSPSIQAAMDQLVEAAVAQVHAWEQQAVELAS